MGTRTALALKTVVKEAVIAQETVVAEVGMKTSKAFFWLKQQLCALLLLNRRRDRKFKNDQFN